MYYIFFYHIIVTSCISIALFYLIVLDIGFLSTYTLCYTPGGVFQAPLCYAYFLHGQYKVSSHRRTFVITLTLLVSFHMKTVYYPSITLTSLSSIGFYYPKPNSSLIPTKNQITLWTHLIVIRLLFYLVPLNLVYIFINVASTMCFNPGLPVLDWPGLAWYSSGINI